MRGAEAAANLKAGLSSWLGSAHAPNVRQNMRVEPKQTRRRWRTLGLSQHGAATSTAAIIIATLMIIIRHHRHHHRHGYHNHHHNKHRHHLSTNTRRCNRHRQRHHDRHYRRNLGHTNAFVMRGCSYRVSCCLVMWSHVATVDDRLCAVPLRGALLAEYFDGCRG